MNAIINTVLFSTLRCTIGLVLCLVVLLTLQIIRISKAPSHIPWVGLRNRRILPKLRACLSELTAGQSMINEGYEKYGKHGKPFILPSLLWNTIILPPSNASWIAQQPDSILSGTTTLDELMGLNYITHGPSAESCRDFTVIRRDLTRQFMRLSNQVYDEIQAAFDDELAKVGDREWTDVKMQQVFLNVAFRAGNRIFVGLPMCRDQAFKRAVDRWTQAFGISTVIISRFLIPEGRLRGLFLRIAGMPMRYLEREAAKFSLPKIKERLARLRDGEGGEDNDMMQWIVNQNASKDDPGELEPQNIAGKMILLNIFATATIGVQGGNTLLSLLSSAHASSIIPQLHAEASEIMPKILNDPRQTRVMHKLDSLIRETLRYNPITPQGLVRQVVKPGGLTTPEGVYLPEGTHVHSIVKSMHHDVDIFGPTAGEFDPLRYYNSSTAKQESQRSAVHISSDFLSWGLGKHACPGRFFAVHVMKLMLGHLFERYDFEPMKEKPKTVQIGDMEFPSEEAVVKMRLRTHA